MTTNTAGDLYILLISIHGLVKGQSPELGRDADTGGQIKYVVEFAQALSKDPRVRRVDLLTRQITDSKVDEIYSRQMEKISEKANIVRIPCGPRRYLRKEVLWNYLDGFSDQAVQYIRRAGKVPDIIHGHYADAGYVGAQISRLLGVPFLFTGHSLGRIKKEHLVQKGMIMPKMEARYNISHRIDAEEFALDTAARVVTSTAQEVEEQYKKYENYSPERMVVIPPGVDLEKFSPFAHAGAVSTIRGEINKFLSDSKKPLILAMSRADERKNIETLIHAYAGNEYLRNNANLVIIAGNRNDIKSLEKGSRKVLTNILLLIDKYNLYGKVAYPKNHAPEDVPEIYRMAAKSKGVFVNPALTEPFGLTIIEAAASGLPVVATNDGGPNDIIRNCGNGLLVDPLDPEKIGKAIQSVIEDRHQWKIYSKNGLKGVKKHYSWSSHVKKYLMMTDKILKKGAYKRNVMRLSKSRLPMVDRMIITDIDNTLLGDADALKEFIEYLKIHGEHAGLGIATGRRLESAIEVLSEWGLPIPDVFITSVGSEINYGLEKVEDRTWSHHLKYYWKPELIREALGELAGLRLQPDIDQRKFKISYYLDPENAPGRNKIISHLRKHKLRVKVILSHNAYLDILPIRASKGLAVRYLAMKWGLPPERILVAGDSGNDEEMLRGNMLGVVVGNFSSELKRLYGKPRIYFAENTYARGILEGIKHYNFFGEQIKTGEENVY